MFGKLADLKLLGSPGKRTKSGSASVGGEVVKKQETEVYIRPDGKKVRRVKTTIVRTKSSDSNSGDIAQMRSSLANTLDAGNSVKPKVNASATVHGSTPASRGIKVAQSFTEGEVYIRADGKKVRRVKKIVDPKSVNDLITPEAEKKASLSASLFNMLNSPASPSGNKKSGAATIGGARVPEGEIYIRPDGKKVRRIIKKAVPADLSEANSAKASLTAKLGTPTKSGAATVSGVARPLEGEIYINKDGKKVRRVPKKSTASVAPPPSGDSLAAKLGSSIKAAPSKSGSASVGAVPNRKIPSRAISYSEGEVYIRADGKKVRRVKKNPALGIHALSLAEKDQALSNMLENPSATPVKAGSASVAGGQVVIKQQVGEIYINADGKKVRRVRKIVTKPKDGAATLAGHMDGTAKVAGPSGAATVAGKPQEGEIYIRADGKKVRRVKKKSEPKTTTKTIAIAKPKAKDDTSLSSNTSLNKFSNKKSSDGASVTSTTSLNKFKKKKSSDGASVTSKTSVTKVKKKKSSDGASAALKRSVQGKSTETEEDDEGFITLTIAKPDSSSPAEVTGAAESSSASTLLDSYLGKLKKSKKKASGSATVTGAMEKKSTTSKKKTGALAVEDDESVVAPTIEELKTGKKAKDDTSHDKPTENDSALDGFLDKKRVSRKGKSGAASVSGDQVASKKGPAIDLREEFRKLREQREKAQAASKAAEAVQIAEDDKEIASKYVKMKQMGLPDDALKHKMVQDGVSEGIICAVLGSVKSEVTDIGSRPAEETEEPLSCLDHLKQLDSAEQAIASKYERMKTMGLPNDALQHKMTQDDVSPNIIAAVLGEEIKKANDRQTAQESNQSVTLSKDEEGIAGYYRGMGLSDDALRLKMTQDEIDSKIIAVVIGDEAKQVTELSALVDHTTSPLCAEEEVIANSDSKMQKMGLPDDAVRHNLLLDGVTPKLVGAATGEEWIEPKLLLSEKGDQSKDAVQEQPSRDEVDTAVAAAISSSLSASVEEQAQISSNPLATADAALSNDEEAIAETYRKWEKMGLSEAAVRHKMDQDGVNDRVIAAVFQDSIPEPASVTTVADSVKAVGTTLTSDEEAVVDKYRKMTKTGLPEEAVRYKMDQDGVSDKIIALVFGESTSDPAGPETGPVSTTSSSSLSEEEMGLASQYAKMKKMGMPEEAIRHKMTQDGVESKIVSAVFGEQPTEKPVDSSKRYALSVDGPKEEQILNETFEVALDHGERTESGKKKYETKFMSLEDIARLSGQSKEALEQLIKDKRKNSEKIPKFVLQPLADDEPSEGDMFEVEVPRTKRGGGGADFAGANPKLKNADPQKLREVQDGQEVVGSDLANAARAVSALGEKDVSALLAQLQQGDMGALLKKMQKLEKQLAQAGIAIAEDIDYDEANKKVAEIAARMAEIGGSDVTHPDKEVQNRLREEYFKLEQEMERYSTALKLTEEYQAEQERMERLWEEANDGPNEIALRKIRRHMPVKIRNMSEAELTNTPSPNGKFLPQVMAKKFKRTNILQLLRVNPDDIERMHPASLENMRVAGLTLTERRAIYAHLKPLGPKWEKNKAEAMTKRKHEWFKMLKLNFKENVAPYQRHVDQYGPPENHVGCPLIGKQCPIKADKLIDYDGDYGWTPEAEYEVSQVTKADSDDPGAKAMQEARELAREKKANERADLLKKHYKGKLLQVSKASGSCESMDETMDKMEFAIGRWIQFIIEKGKDESDADKKKEVANFTDTLNDIKLGILDYCKRSGIQTSGKKTAGGDGPDIRSAIECGLAVEVYEHGQEFFKFIKNRLKELDARDARVEKTIELLETMLSELNEKNKSTLASLGVPCPDKSRKLKKAAEIRKEIEEKMQPSEETPAEEDSPSTRGPHGGGGRGGLLGEIAGRGGRGGLLDSIKGGRGRGGGRGDLLAGIAGRGRGGRGAGGDGGGRGGLLAAIQGRGAGNAGGRGGLLAAIQGRGAGDTGGRGGLLAAIQGRGAPDAGGRGGLLAAIQARGGGG
ncbi:hypothetical protein FisN_8Lh344 [Fistulifera solaris]|uniref:Uncharacterized protein n=1 Tax=Fistulifera solaris TaxID=1519565 RepID=A0A1Z5JMY7_FISSO|nr:hypothetical protein FisN_8Lh344 [Fistulifera solaris]|eukprot:GAX15365.1 hypothetical protein FisN_8Lh344 [Fistulifera solaris]